MDKQVQETEMKNPLEDLFEEESQVSAHGDVTLANLVKPYLYLGKKTRKIILRDDAFNLPVKLRILLLFMGSLALKRLGSGEGTFSQKEIIEYFSQYGVPEGTIKVSLKQLRDDRLITEAEASRYMTGYDKLSKIQMELSKHGRSEN